MTEITPFFHLSAHCTQFDDNDKIDDKISIEITNGSFTWDDPKVPQLKNINLKMKPGSLTAVVGVVGSGKSSLLQGTSKYIFPSIFCFYLFLEETF